MSNFNSQYLKADDLNFLVEKLISKIQKLEKENLANNNRIKQLESCQCVKTCYVNGTVLAHGVTWNEKCHLCSCEVS